MSASLKDNEIYCPECGTLIKEGNTACSNCKLKIQGSAKTSVIKEDISLKEPSFLEEELKKLSSIPTNDTSVKGAPEKIKIEKTIEPEKKQEEVENGGTSFEKELKTFEAAQESQDADDKPEKEVEDIVEKSKTEEKKSKDK